MTFGDDLKAAIDRAREEASAEQAADTSFTKWWKQFRQEVWATLQQAEATLEASQFKASLKDASADSFVLTFGNNKTRVLQITAVPAERRVRCSWLSVTEYYAQDKLDRATLEKVVTRAVYESLRPEPRQRPEPATS